MAAKPWLRKGRRALIYRVFQGVLMRRNALGALLAAAVIGGAPAAQAQSAPPAAVAAPPREDPWEQLNRTNYAIERALDRHLIGPVAKVFRALTPGPIGRGLHNVLVNLSEPSVFINDVLQLRFKKASVTAERFVTNSTVGVLGLVDVAGRLGLPHHDNEFGVTLGRYGVYPGPYMYLPLGGPTTLRDLVGTGVDLLLDPFHWARFASQAEINGARLVVGGLDTRNSTEDELNTLLSDATDPYATLRSVYLQNKQGEVDGEGAPANLPNFDEPAPTAAPAPAAENSLADPLAEGSPDGLLGGDLDRITQLGGVVGSVHGPGGSLASEGDQVAGDQAGLDHGLDLAAPELGPGESPERPPVVAADADLPQNLGQQGQAQADVAPGGPLPTCWTRDAMGVGGANLVLVARE
jgi:phospholipid-binding lipoprotein MlaA